MLGFFFEKFLEKFLNKISWEFPESFPDKIYRRIPSEIISVQIFERILREVPVQILEWFHGGIAGEILGKFS